MAKATFWDNLGVQAREQAGKAMEVDAPANTAPQRSFWDNLAGMNIQPPPDTVSGPYAAYNQAVRQSQMPASPPLPQQPPPPPRATFQFDPRNQMLGVIPAAQMEQGATVSTSIPQQSVVQMPDGTYGEISVGPDGALSLVPVREETLRNASLIGRPRQVGTAVPPDIAERWMPQQTAAEEKRLATTFPSGEMDMVGRDVYDAMQLPTPAAKMGRIYDIAKQHAQSAAQAKDEKIRNKHKQYVKDVFERAFPNADLDSIPFDDMVKTAESGGGLADPIAAGFYEPPDEETAKMYELAKGLVAPGEGGVPSILHGEGTSVKDMVKFYKDATPEQRQKFLGILHGVAGTKLGPIKDKQVPNAFLRSWEQAAQGIGVTLSDWFGSDKELADALAFDNRVREIVRGNMPIETGYNGWLGTLHQGLIDAASNSAYYTIAEAITPPIPGGGVLGKKAAEKTLFRKAAEKLAVETLRRAPGAAAIPLMVYPQLKNELLDAGVPEEQAKKLAIASSFMSGAIEQIVPGVGAKGPRVDAFGRGLAKRLTEYGVKHSVHLFNEWSEEGIEAAKNLAIKKMAESQYGAKINWENEKENAYNQFVDAFVPLLIMQAPGMVVGGATQTVAGVKESIETPRIRARQNIMRTIDPQTRKSLKSNDPGEVLRAWNTLPEDVRGALASGSVKDMNAAASGRKHWQATEAEQAAEAGARKAMGNKVTPTSPGTRVPSGRVGASDKTIEGALGDWQPPENMQAKSEYQLSPDAKERAKQIEEMKQRLADMEARDKEMSESMKEPVEPAPDTVAQPATEEKPTDTASDLDTAMAKALDEELGAEEEEKPAEKPFAEQVAELRTGLVRMFGNRQDAEDLADEAIVSALESEDKFDPSKSSLKTWLHNIAKNKARDAGRKLGRRKEVQAPAEMDVPAPETTEDPGDVKLSKDDLRKMEPEMLERMWKAKHRGLPVPEDRGRLINGIWQTIPKDKRIEKTVGKKAESPESEPIPEPGDFVVEYEPDIDDDEPRPMMPSDNFGDIEKRTQALSPEQVEGKWREVTGKKGLAPGKTEMARQILEAGGELPEEPSATVSQQKLGEKRVGRFAGKTDEELAAMEQMYSDNIRTRESSGKQVPQEWRDGLQEVRAIRAGANPETEFVTDSDYYGHPENGGTKQNDYGLIPIKIDANTDLSWRIERASKLREEYGKLVGEAARKKKRSVSDTENEVLFNELKKTEQYLYNLKDWQEKQSSATVSEPAPKKMGDKPALSAAKQYVRDFNSIPREQQTHERVNEAMAEIGKMTHAQLKEWVGEIGKPVLAGEKTKAMLLAMLKRDMTQPMDTRSRFEAREKAPSDWKPSAVSAVKGTKIGSEKTLPQLFEEMKKQHPGLTKDEFLAGMKQLHDEGKVKLDDWTRAPADVPDPSFLLHTQGESWDTVYGHKWFVREAAGTVAETAEPEPVAEAGPVEFREQSKGNNAPGVEKTVMAKAGERYILLERNKFSTLWSIREPGKYTGEVKDKTAVKSKDKELASGIQDLRKAKDVATRILNGTFDPEADLMFDKEDKTDLGATNADISKLISESGPVRIDSFAALLREKGWATDGRMLVRVSDKDRDAILSKVKSTEGRPVNIDPILDQADKVAGQSMYEMSPVAYRGGDIEERNVVLTNKYGDFLEVSKRLHDTVMKKYPKAVPYGPTEMGGIAYQSGGDVVGVVMPKTKEKPDAYMKSLMAGKYWDEFGEKPSATVSEKPTRKQKADAALDKAKQEFDTAMRELGKSFNTLNVGVNPEQVMLAVKAIKAALSVGVATFDKFVASCVEYFGREKTMEMADHLESAWRMLKKRKAYQDVIDDAGKVADVLGQMEEKKPTDTVADEPPSDVPPPEQPTGNDLGEVIGIKNEIVDQLRVSRGKEPTEAPPKESAQQWLDDAHALLEQNSSAAEMLVTEFDVRPRAPSDVEHMLLAIHYGQLYNAYEKASDRLFAAREAGNTAHAVMYQAEVDNLQDRLDKLERVTRSVGTESGRSLASRKFILFREDYTLAGLLRRARVANGGKQLSAEEQAKIKKMADRIKELEGQIENDNAAKAEAAINRGVDAEIEKHKPKKTMGKRAPRKSQVSDRIKAASERVNAAWKKFNAASTSGAGALGAHLVEPLIEIVKAYAELGVAHLSELVSRIKQDGMVENIDQMQDALKEAWAQTMGRGVIAAPDVDIADPRSLSRLAKKLTRFVVEGGVRGRDDIVSAVHNELQQWFPDITERQTKEAISGYGIFDEIPKDDVSVLVRAAQSELLQVLKLEDMESGLAPQKTGKERGEPTDEYRRLTKLVNEAKKKGGYAITDPVKQLKSAVSAATTAVRNSIADMEADIAAGEKRIKQRGVLQLDPSIPEHAALIELRKTRDEVKKLYEAAFPKTDEEKIAALSKALDRTIARLDEQVASQDIVPKARTPLTSPELEAKRAKRDALRENLSELRKNSPEYQASVEERQNAAYKRGLAKRIAEYQRRIAEHDYSKKPKKERHLDDNTLEMLYQLDQERRKFQAMEEAWKRKQLTGAAKVYDVAKSITQTSRSIITSIDWSAVLRQGNVVLMSHPKLAIRAIPKAWKATWSEKEAFRAAEELRQRPNHRLYMQAKLALTAIDAKLTAQEEAFLGHWSRNNWLMAPVAASERAYVTTLNEMRANLFDTLVATLSRKGTPTMEEARLIAEYVNAATGRGSLWKFEAAAEGLATVFFSPRLVASRFQILTAKTAFKSLFQGEKRVAGLLFKEYARTLVGWGTMIGSIMLAAAALYDDDDENKPTITFDPRSSDFGKLKIRNTRIDLLGGFSQVIVLGGQLGSGKYVDAGGNVVDMWGENRPQNAKTMMGTAGNFVRSKLAPIPGTATNIVFRENFLGEPTTLWGVVGDNVIPMSVRDVSKAYSDLPVPEATIASLYGILGAGLNTREQGDIAEFYSDVRHVRDNKIAMSTPENIRVSRAQPLVAAMRKAAKDMEKNGESTVELERYATGVARWALGKKDDPKYPNPFTSQGVPPYIKKMVREHLATVARTAASIENPYKADKDKVAQMNAAQSYLKQLGVRADDVMGDLMEKLQNSGVKSEGRRNWRSRLRRALY